MVWLNYYSITLMNQQKVLSWTPQLPRGLADSTPMRRRWVWSKDNMPNATLSGEGGDNDVCQSKNWGWGAARVDDSGVSVSKFFHPHEIYGSHNYDASIHTFKHDITWPGQEKDCDSFFPPFTGCFLINVPRVLTELDDDDDDNDAAAAAADSLIDWLIACLVGWLVDWLWLLWPWWHDNVHDDDEYDEKEEREDGACFLAGPQWCFFIASLVQSNGHGCHGVSSNDGTAKYELFPHEWCSFTDLKVLLWLNKTTSWSPFFSWVEVLQDHK